MPPTSIAPWLALASAPLLSFRLLPLVSSSPPFPLFAFVIMQFNQSKPLLHLLEPILLGDQEAFALSLFEVSPLMSVSPQRASVPAPWPFYLLHLLLLFIVSCTVSIAQTPSFPLDLIPQFDPGLGDTAGQLSLHWEFGSSGPKQTSDLACYLAIERSLWPLEPAIGRRSAQIS